MLPVPMEAPSAVMKAWNGVSGPPAPSCRAGTRVRRPKPTPNRRNRKEPRRGGGDRAVAKRRGVGHGPEVGAGRQGDGVANDLGRKGGDHRVEKKKGPGRCGGTGLDYGRLPKTRS